MRAHPGSTPSRQRRRLGTTDSLGAGVSRDVRPEEWGHIFVSSVHRALWLYQFAYAVLALAAGLLLGRVAAALLVALAVWGLGVIGYSGRWPWARAAWREPLGGATWLPLLMAAAFGALAGGAVTPIASVIGSLVGFHVVVRTPTLMSAITRYNSSRCVSRRFSLVPDELVLRGGWFARPVSDEKLTLVTGLDAGVGDVGGLEGPLDGGFGGWSGGVGGFDG